MFHKNRGYKKLQEKETWRVGNFDKIVRGHVFITLLLFLKKENNNC